ncbi:hypothetical protein ABGB07_11895 [Micromonosporaceae bacterium B7E4]
MHIEYTMVRDAAYARSLFAATLRRNPAPVDRALPADVQDRSGRMAG